MECNSKFPSFFQGKSEIFKYVHFFSGKSSDDGWTLWIDATQLYM